MRDTSASERDYIASLLAKDFDELYMLIAQGDPSNADVLFAPTQARAKGERTFKDLLAPLRKKICTEWKYCSRRHDPELQDNVTLVASLADVVSTIIGGIPANIVAALLVKKGLTALCRCKRNE